MIKKEVSEHLASKDIFSAPKTIYGWESGLTQPSADTLMELCSFYQIEDILTTFGYVGDDSKTMAPVLLTEDELCVLNAYREKKEMQDAVRKLLDVQTKKSLATRHTHTRKRLIATRLFIFIM